MENLLCVEGMCEDVYYVAGSVWVSCDYWCTGVGKGGVLGRCREGKCVGEVQKRKYGKG